VRHEQRPLQLFVFPRYPAFRQRLEFHDSADVPFKVGLSGCGQPGHLLARRGVHVCEYFVGWKLFVGAGSGALGAGDAHFFLFNFNQINNQSYKQTHHQNTHHAHHQRHTGLLLHRPQILLVIEHENLPFDIDVVFDVAEIATDKACFAVSGGLFVEVGDVFGGEEGAELGYLGFGDDVGRHVY